MRTGGVSDLLLAEAPEVRAEMLRLHETHNVLGYALRLAVKDKLGDEASWEDANAETVEYVKKATAELLA